MGSSLSLRVRKSSVIALGGVFALTVGIAPASEVWANEPTSAHPAGLYLAVGQPTQLMRGQVSSDGSIEMEPLGSVQSPGYNALAAHRSSSELYAISGSTGSLVRLHTDGTTELVDALGTSSSVASFAGELSDQFFYLPQSAHELAWFDVATGERGSVPPSQPFQPHDMAWSNGYFWGLSSSGGEAILARLALNGEVTAEPIPGVDLSSFQGGTFGGAWTYGNGNLGFAANGGGAVQVRIISADPISAEVVGYTAMPGAGSIDAAMLPAHPGDIKVHFETSWIGAGEPVEVASVVTNTGQTAVSGYQLRLGPGEPESRTVEGLAHCVVDANAHVCGGGALLPGESRVHEFRLMSPEPGEVAASRWIAHAELNEEELNPADNSAVLLLPDATEPELTIEMKARVIDANGDGSASDGEVLEVYALLVNEGQYTLSGVMVSMREPFAQVRRLPESMGPGAHHTLMFSETVPENMEVVGISATAQMSEGDTMVLALSNTLWVVGEKADPVPGGSGSATGSSDDVNHPGDAGSSGATGPNDKVVWADRPSSPHDSSTEGESSVGVRLSNTGADQSVLFVALGAGLLVASGLAVFWRRRVR